MMARTNAEDENCIGYRQDGQRRILKSLKSINGAVSQKIRAAAMDLYEELYHPCFVNIDLPSIEGVRSKRVNENDQRREKTDGPQGDASQDGGPPMTFR